MTNGLFGGCFGHFNMYHHLNRSTEAPLKVNTMKQRENGAFEKKYFLTLLLAHAFIARLVECSLKLKSRITQ